MQDQSTKLPIEAMRDQFRIAFSQGPVVLTAPTGSGKSTQVPRWLARESPVIVIEPRRVACRGLAQRVALLEGSQLGHSVGYRVRDDDRSSADTRILFVTPGVALRMLAQPLGWPDTASVVIDEFHERSMDVDLVLALLKKRNVERLVVMSATIDTEPLRLYLGGRHVGGQGRGFPVDVRHLDTGEVLPSRSRLVDAVPAALEASKELPGDFLIFLPGKGEIRDVARAINQICTREQWEILTLHGGLSLGEQAKVFEPGPKRRVVLSTNVAETSVTVPRIGVVIDSGLVRRTEYHGGRGFLTLAAIARDSADQRAGRAGRLMAGVCLRLWSRRAGLAPVTKPELHRESITPLVHAAAACQFRVAELDFLDPPKAFAVEAAQSELAALGAIDSSGRITPTGSSLFGMPLDAALGKMLLVAQGSPSLNDTIDLVAALSVGRSLFLRPLRPHDDDADLRREGCDALALIAAIRRGEPTIDGLNSQLLGEARQNARRLRKAFGIGVPKVDERVDRAALVQLLLRADRRMAYIARHRKRGVAWGNGGTEAVLGQRSALSPILEVPEGRRVEAVVALQVRAVMRKGLSKVLVIDYAIPIRLSALSMAGVGRVSSGDVSVQNGVLHVEQLTKHAGKELDKRLIVPEGQTAKGAFAVALENGSIFSDAMTEVRENLRAWGFVKFMDEQSACQPPFTFLVREWLDRRIAELGIESGADLALLSDADFVVPPPEDYLLEKIRRTYPSEIVLPDVRYRIEYRLETKTVVLVRVSGHRCKAPPLAWLPTFSGFRILIKDQRGESLLRGRV